MSRLVDALDRVSVRTIKQATDGLWCARCGRPIRGRGYMRGYLRDGAPAFAHDQCPTRLQAAAAWLPTVILAAGVIVGLLILATGLTACGDDRPDRCTTAGVCE